jgi:hypothetical protein
MMKKLALTIAIVLAMGMTSFAQIDPETYEQQGGGLFGRGLDFELFGADESLLKLPEFGEEEDVDADAPLGSGIALLMGLGGAYLVGKKRKKE